MNEITQNDTTLVRFLQQWGGYSISGDVREQALVFLYGPGGNGKGVWVRIIQRAIGSYAHTASIDTFVASKMPRHATDLASLAGKRFVTASELDPGRYWAESRIKQLTGGDRISANFMRQDPFEFSPVCKLTFMANRKPGLHGVDEASRRRFNMVSLNFKPQTVDLQLEQKLMLEAPAILRWLIDGCPDWQKHGLQRPQCVLDATKSYFEDQNLFADWICECCDLDPGNEYKTETAANLFASWTTYAKAAGAEPGSKSDFGSRLKDDFQYETSQRRKRRPLLERHPLPPASPATLRRSTGQR